MNVGKKKKSDTASEILVAAKRLIAQKGYESTSIKEISDLAGVNVSAISYHFGSKEELLIAILKDFAGEGLVPACRPIENPAKSLEEFRLRLELFCQNLFDQRRRDHDAFVICSMEQRPINNLHEKVKEEAFGAVETLVFNFFSTAQESGILDSSYCTEFLASLILGQFKSMITKNHTCENGKALLDDDLAIRGWISNLIDVFLNGAAAKPS